MDALSSMKEHKALLADIHRQVEGRSKTINAALETLGALIDSPEGRAQLAAVRRVRARYADSSARVLNLVEAGKLPAAMELMNAETLPALDALQAQMKRMLETRQKTVPARHFEVKHRIDSALTMMTVMEGAPAAVWRPSHGDS